MTRQDVKRQVVAHFGTLKYIKGQFMVQYKTARQETSTETSKQASNTTSKQEKSVSKQVRHYNPVDKQANKQGQSNKK